MDSLNRFLHAIFLEEPDVVPVFELAIDKIVMMKVLQRKEPIDRWLDIEGYCDCYRKLDMDGITFWDSPPLEKGLKRRGDLWLDEWGRKWRSPYPGFYGFYVDGTIKAPEDLERFEPPDPNDEERIGFFGRAIKEAKRRGLAVVAGIHDAYEIPSQMMGVTNFLINLFQNPSFVRKIIGLSVRYNIELAKTLIDEGVDVVMSGDDYAYKSGLVMSPKHFEEFIYPSLKKLVKSVHERDVPFIKHTDGYIWSIMDPLINCHIEALHPLEPMAGMDIGEAKEKLGDKICLIGNIDCSHTLSLKDVTDVVQEVDECIKKASPGGGHIISSSNSIHDACKVENVVAMVKAARKYGKYGTISSARVNIN